MILTVIDYNKVDKDDLPERTSYTPDQIDELAEHIKRSKKEIIQTIANARALRKHEIYWMAPINMSKLIPPHPSDS